MTRFGVGDMVLKVGSGHAFAGVVLVVFRRRSGEVCYVVEDEHGGMHICASEHLVSSGDARSRWPALGA